MKVPLGWSVSRNEFALHAFEPERICPKPSSDGVPGRRKVSMCPAVSAFYRRVYQIRSPYDIHLRLQETEDPSFRELGGFRPVVVNPENSSVKPEKINEVVKIHKAADWDHPKQPILEIQNLLVFVSDIANVWVEVLPPLLSYEHDSLPGKVICGSFDIHAWQRPVSFAFEWIDIDRPLKISRGAPLFYVKFQTPHPDDTVDLRRIPYEGALQKQVEQCLSVNAYIRGSFSIFPLARKLRPKSFLSSLEK